MRSSKPAAGACSRCRLRVPEPSPRARRLPSIPQCRRHARGLTPGPPWPRPQTPDRSDREPARPRSRLPLTDRADRHHDLSRPPAVPHLRRPGRIREGNHQRAHPRRPSRRPRPGPTRRPPEPRHRREARRRPDDASAETHHGRDLNRARDQPRDPLPPPGARRRAQRPRRLAVVRHGRSPQIRGPLLLLDQLSSRSQRDWSGQYASGHGSLLMSRVSGR